MTQSGGKQSVDEWILSQLNTQYSDICYRGMFIKKVLQILNRSMVQVILHRNDDVGYQINAEVKL